jgi:hypothetical protein
MLPEKIKSLLINPLHADVRVEHHVKLTDFTQWLERTADLRERFSSGRNCDLSLESSIIVHVKAKGTNGRTITGSRTKAYVIAVSSLTSSEADSRNC